MTDLVIRPLVAGEENLFDSMPDPLPQLRQVAYADPVGNVNDFDPSVTRAPAAGLNERLPSESAVTQTRSAAPFGSPARPHRTHPSSLTRSCLQNTPGRSTFTDRPSALAT